MKYLLFFFIFISSVAGALSGGRENNRYYVDGFKTANQEQTGFFILNAFYEALSRSIEGTVFFRHIDNCKNLFLESFRKEALALPDVEILWEGKHETKAFEVWCIEVDKNRWQRMDLRERRAFVRDYEFWQNRSYARLFEFHILKTSINDEEIDVFENLLFDLRTAWLRLYNDDKDPFRLFLHHFIFKVIEPYAKQFLTLPSAESLCNEILEDAEKTKNKEYDVYLFYLCFQNVAIEMMSFEKQEKWQSLKRWQRKDFLSDLIRNHYFENQRRILSTFY